MNVIQSDRVVYFDCDDTLVLWGRPFNSTDTEIIVSTQDVGEVRVVKHRKHIEKLIEHKLRGHKVVVWSAGGWEWAEAVVKSLNIEKFVDLVMCKPAWVYDDLPASEFIPESSRVYYPQE